MKPSFPTLNDIRRVIPSHCFVPSVGRSFAYVGRDLLFIVLLFLTMVRLDSYLDDSVKWIPWLAYFFLQGLVFWGVFVLGHDCGHESFSKSKTVNAIVGNALHSFLMVPFKSWALSHRYHHRNTGNYLKDEPFAPEIAEGFPDSTARNSSWHRFRRLMAASGLLWFPYLIGVSREVKSHYYPGSKVFQGYENEVKVSLFSNACMLALLIGIGTYWGFLNLAMYYLIPLMVSGAMLVYTTFLHHNDPDIPWYPTEEWNFVKGNLSTIDRSYAPFNNIIHDIGTHQVHHLFSFIPHYHLKEATQHFRKHFPELVRVSNRSLIVDYFKALHHYSVNGFVEKKRPAFVYEEVSHERNYPEKTEEKLGNLKSG